MFRVDPPGAGGRVPRLLRGTLLIGLAVAGTTFPTAGARGDGAADVRARATADLREGARLMEERSYERAVERFQEAYRLVPSPKVLFNLGVAYSALGRHAEAMAAFEGFLRGEVNAPPSSVATARRQVAELRAKVATLRLESDRATASVSIDGRDLGAVPLNRELTVDPGHHEVRATAGDRAIQQQVDVAAGGRAVVPLTFERPIGGVPIEAGGSSRGSRAAVAVSAPLPAPLQTSGAPLVTATSPQASGGEAVSERPLYRKPWFWLATGGVVAVAAVVLAVSLGRTEFPTADSSIEGP